MTTIKLEIPSNDPSALFHMGEALRNIAKENGYIVQDAPQQRVTKTETIGDTSMTVITEPVYRERSAIVQEVLNQPEHRDALAESAIENNVSICMNPETLLDIEDDELLSPHVTVVEYEPGSDIVTTSDELIDADGLPHDKRIHSKGATRLNDDTWRMKKKPADKTDEEWAEFVDGVKAELKQLMDIPVATGEALDVLADKVGIVRQATLTPPTLDELAVADLEQCDTGFEGVTPNGDVAIEQQPIVLPPIKNPFEANPVVTPPIVNSVTPPIVNSVTPPVTITQPTDSDAPNTFPLFMKWLTTNNKKLTSDMVNKVLNDNGVTAIPLLTSRVDLIPQIHAELVKLL